MRHVDGGGEPWPASLVKGTAPGEIRRSLQQFDFSETVVPHAWGDQGFHRLGRLQGMGDPGRKYLANHRWQNILEGSAGRHAARPKLSSSNSCLRNAIRRPTGHARLAGR